MGTSPQRNEGWGYLVTVAITIPLYNQLHYTKICLQSIGQDLTDSARLILVDNASTDGTGEYLAGVSGVSIVSNADNLGCAGAWNQGVRYGEGAEWHIILNNDVIVPSGWIEGLLEAAERWKLDIVSPGFREGEYNYDIQDYSREYISTMNTVIRPGQAHGICFMVHRRVFEQIGFFDENFRIGQYEDTDFFLRARQAGLRLGIVGSSFLHHFGSVTQNAMVKAQKTKPYALENKAYFIRKWRLTWWRRKYDRNLEKVVNRLHSIRELALHRHTLIEKWIGGRLRYY
jgi:GT2 family glycosyltransferase